MVAGHVTWQMKGEKQGSETAEAAQEDGFVTPFTHGK